MNKKERQVGLINNEDGKNLSSKENFNKIVEGRCKEITELIDGSNFDISI